MTPEPIAADLEPITRLDFRDLRRYFQDFPAPLLRTMADLPAIDGVRFDRLRATRRIALEELDRRSSVAAASAAIEHWSLLLPTRITNEDLGDHLEDIARARGMRLWSKVAGAVFSSGVNAVVYVISILIGRSKRGT
jgi:hypothetical protein